jgi:hypothetical protein
MPGWTPRAVLDHWPLPSRLSASSVAATLKHQPAERLTLTSDATGHPILNLEGPLLPWLLPGAALRWFADWAEEQEGRVRLRETIARLDREAPLTAAPPLSPAEMDRLQPAQKTLAAFLQFDERNNGRSGIPRQLPIDFDDTAQQLATDGLPISLDTTTNKVESVLRTYARHGAQLDPEIPAHRYAPLREAVFPGQRYDLPALEYMVDNLALQLVTTGRLLALTGDAQGITTADRALRLLALPNHQELATIMAKRDDAYLVSLVGGWLGAPSRSTWLAETWIQPTAWWRNQRRNGTDAARQMLAENPGVDGVLAARDYRAWRTEVATSTLLWQRQGELGDVNMSITPPGAAWNVDVDPGSPQPWPFAQARHHLMRLAARIRGLSETQPLPADPAMLAKQIGVLRVPFGSLVLPLSYARRGERGFRLAVDTSGARPDPLSDHLWNAWRQAKPAPPGCKLALPESSLEVVIDQPRGGKRENQPNF